MSLTEQIKKHAIDIGFDLVSITSCNQPPNAEFLDTWLSSGFAGEMEWMKKHTDVRKNPEILSPGCRSIIVVAQNYYQHPINEEVLFDLSRGRIASYAWGRDYHKVLGNRLKKYVAEIKEITGKDIQYKTFVDTGPVLEKSVAFTANLGFISKNTLLVTPRFGSWIFLGVVLLDLELEQDPAPPFWIGCGDCSICKNHCPTKALENDYVMEANRCISYLTIEHRDPIPYELRPLMKNWIFGCDACQLCCPYNARNKPVTGEADFICKDIDRMAPKLTEIMQMDEKLFLERFKGSPVIRAKRKGLLRNAAIAVGNWGSPEALYVLENSLLDHEPLIRGHAAWATGRIKNSRSVEMLYSAMKKETNEYVKEEISKAIEDNENLS